MALIDSAADSLLKTADKLPKLIFDGLRSDSLIEYTKSTRVEPITLVDRRVLHVDFMPDLMQSLNHIFAGYYLRAVALAAHSSEYQTYLGNVDAVKVLDKLNPSRDLVGASSDLVLGAENRTMDAEAYQYQLPVPGQTCGIENYGVDLGLEKEGDKASGTKANIRADGKEAVNLSIGLTYDVEMHVGKGNNKASATFPVNIRLLVNSTPSDVLTHILSSGKKDLSAKERFHKWRSGRISLIKDLILAQDLIDSHRKNLMRDKSDHYEKILNRRNMNRVAAMITKEFSVATASNIMVISEETKKEIERNINSRLDKFRTREEIFQETYVMLLVVVDPEWEQVTIYHRSIDEPTELSARDIKKSSKKDVDVGEILKAYTVGNSPTL